MSTFIQVFALGFTMVVAGIGLATAVLLAAYRDGPCGMGEVSSDTAEPGATPSDPRS